MTDSTPKPSGAAADRVHSIRLRGGSSDGILGTITGPLPLWFVHRGVSYIRMARDELGPDGLATTAYRAV